MVGEYDNFIAIQHIKDMLENESKIVIFAHHLDVLNTLHEEFKDEAVILTGQTKPEDRQLAVDRFQNNEEIKLFIGSIQAAGVGITLTAASTEIFVELDWVPANISQAESRCHRIGQLGSVLVQHLVLDGSLDAHMVQTLIAKQDVLDEALDAPIEEREPFILPTLPIEEPSTARVTKREIYEEAETIAPEQIDAVHEGLMMLAMLDPDRASEINQEGFNAVDAKIGHDLAWQARLTPKQAILGRKILRKYRRQLGNELMERMGSTGGD
ncbi:MAG TPA: SWF/SNF helicase family protein [Clostridiaceae bacterium]|nr:SWF/SNF helicase family protein [Clostridiaceae bacterium]